MPASQRCSPLERRPTINLITFTFFHDAPRAPEQRRRQFPPSRACARRDGSSSVRMLAEYSQEARQRDVGVMASDQVSGFQVFELIDAPADQFRYLPSNLGAPVDSSSSSQPRRHLQRQPAYTLIPIHTHPFRHFPAANIPTSEIWPASLSRRATFSRSRDLMS